MMLAKLLHHNANVDYSAITEQRLIIKNNNPTLTINVNNNNSTQKQNSHTFLFICAPQRILIYCFRLKYRFFLIIRQSQ